MNYSDILNALSQEESMKSIELAEKIVSNNVLSEIESKILNNFIKKSRVVNHPVELQAVMSQDEYDSILFDVQPIKIKLQDAVDLFIKQRKDEENSRILLNLSTRVRQDGITDDVVNELYKITKSDTIDNTYQDISDNLEDMYKRKVGNDGIKTGCNAIDQVIGGLRTPSVTTLLGWTGSGKSTWSLNIAYNGAKDGINTAYISLELTKEDILYSLYSRHSFDPKFGMMIPHGDIKRRRLEDAQVEKIFKEIKPDFEQLPGKIYILDEAELESYSFNYIEKRLRELDNLATAQTGHGIDLIVVDHVNLLKFNGHGSTSRQSEGSVINEFVGFFRQQSVNFLHDDRQVAVLLVAQANRQGWMKAVRNEGRYAVNAISEANELERASSYILSIFVDESLKASKEAKVQLLKSRDGSLLLDPQITYVDFVYYVVGDVVDNATANFSDNDLNAIFGATDVDLNLDNIESENMINDLDLGDLNF